MKSDPTQLTNHLLYTIASRPFNNFSFENRWGYVRWLISQIETVLIQHEYKKDSDYPVILFDESVDAIWSLSQEFVVLPFLINENERIEIKLSWDFAPIIPRYDIAVKINEA